MPITSSAKKALRSSQRKQVYNLRRKKAMTDAIKKLKKLVSNKKIDEAKGFIPQVYRVIDKAAKTNLIKKNTASRKKSRLAQFVKKSA
jgi:small subunit ribosomal protein S20